MPKTPPATVPMPSLVSQAAYFCYVTCIGWGAGAWLLAWSAGSEAGPAILRRGRLLATLANLLVVIVLVVVFSDRSGLWSMAMLALLLPFALGAFIGVRAAALWVSLSWRKPASSKLHEMQERAMKNRSLPVFCGLILAALWAAPITADESSSSPSSAAGAATAAGVPGGV